MNICYICDKITNDLYECNECGHLVCEDHIIDNGNSIDDIILYCTECIDNLRF